ncbi:unnamed protein product [Moneuplotes crassus]|uniref:Uncharacterized protein n=1 Tax=Euplotes crassus TaxID=5936 RepID=A0AAD1UIS3_EUPCR|nr:unnamed protein product [Moneuplotes crassus]
MGIDTQRFIKQVPDKLLCFKCENVLVKPKQCGLCSIMICKDCLDDLNKKPCNCGVKYVSTNKFLLNKLQSLIIKCKYYPAGCSFTARLGEIAKHEAPCHFKNSAMAAGSRDSFSTKSKGSMPKPLKPVVDVNDLPDKESPFSESTYFITCMKGCNKRILTKKEFESHSCIDHLKNIIKDQNKEKEMLKGHLQEAEKDVKDLFQEINRCKLNQESAIDELKEKLMFLENKNAALKEQRARKVNNYEERRNEENMKNEQESDLSFINFIQTAEKDFIVYNQRINTDFDKYKDRLNEETYTYKLKTKANSMMKETANFDGGYKRKSPKKNKSLKTTPKAKIAGKKR